MALEIVGWVCDEDNHCSCGAVATVIVSNDGDYFSACNDCVESDVTHDRIAEVLLRAFSNLRD